MHQYHWLEELHTAYYATLVRLARNKLRRLSTSTADAEDVVQEAFLLAAEKDIRHSKNPLGWLIKTTSNLCLQQMHRVRHEAAKEQRLIRHKLDNSFDRSIYAIDREESETDALLLLLLLEQSLSPEDWEIMRKYCIDGIPLDEIAAELNMPINRLRVKIHRIRRKFRTTCNFTP